MFYIAKPFQLGHRPGPSRKPVMRLTCILALTCLFAACTPPPKAVEVPEPVTKPRNRPARVDDAPAAPLQMVNQGQGAPRLLPDLTQRLPDARDMRATTEQPKQDGPTVRAKAPDASE